MREFDELWIFMLGIYAMRTAILKQYPLGFDRELAQRKYDDRSE